MSAEDTPETTVVDHRWDSPKGREDWKTYDYVYEVAESVRKVHDHPSDAAASKLMLTVINEWEKAPRSVPMTILLGTISLADAYAGESMVGAAELEPA